MLHQKRMYRVDRPCQPCAGAFCQMVLTNRRDDAILVPVRLLARLAAFGHVFDLVLGSRPSHPTLDVRGISGNDGVHQTR